MSYPFCDPSADDIALQDAAAENNVEAVRDILARTRQTVLDVQALIFAIQFSAIDAAHALLDDPRIDPSTRWSRALEEAVASAEFGLVERMMVHPNINCTAGLQWAVQTNLTEMVKLFLADPRTQIGDSLHMAVHWMSRDCIPLLLADPRTDPSVDDNKALRKAVKNRDLASINMLLAEPRVVARLGTIVQTVPIHAPALVTRLANRAWTRRREAVMAFALHQTALLQEETGAET